MVLSIWWLRDLFIGIPILVGAITYLGLIYLFQVFTIEDRILMKQIVQIVLIRLRLINPRTANLGERNL
jgi:hypothetical protein